MKIKRLLVGIMATTGFTSAFAVGSIESAPATTVDVAPAVVIVDTPIIVTTPTPAPVKKITTKAVEPVGKDSTAPTGKYVTSQKPVTDEPAFAETSRGTAADIPASAYLTVEMDLDPEGIPGVSFSDASTAITLGMSKAIANTNWGFGAYVQQTLPIQSINGSPAAGQNTLGRIFTSYTLPFGLFNSLAIDEIYNSPQVGVNFTYPNTTDNGIAGDAGDSQYQRVELFNRYDTQYSKTFYQFVGQRDRFDNLGGYNLRAFGGFGFNFTDRDNWENTFDQTWYKNQGSTTVFPQQNVYTTYSHTFANKFTSYYTITWQGSNYGGPTYSNSFGAEAGINVPL